MNLLNNLNIKNFTYNWFIFSVLIIVTIVVVEGFFEYKKSIENIIHKTDNITIPLAKKLEKDFEQAENLLILAEDILFTLPKENKNFLEGNFIQKKRIISEKFNLLVEVFKPVSVVNFADATGNIIYSSNTNYSKFNTSSRDYFQKLQLDKDLKNTFSNVVFSPTSNKKAVIQARAVRDENGDLIGVLTALIDIDYIYETLASINTGKNGIALLRNSENSMLISRNPPFDEKNFVGDLDALNPITQRIKKGENSGNFDYIVSTDKVERIGSFKKMDKYPFYVHVALSKSEALMQWKRTLFIVTFMTILFIFGSILLFILMKINYKKEIVLKNKLEESLKNLEKLIENQSNIIILSDGREMKYANSKFFEFLGFKNIEDFKRNHKCICEFFVEDDRFFHLKLIDDEANWVNEIRVLEETKRIVAMYKKRASNLHVFSVSINDFDEDTTIISFTDISQTIKEKMKLEKKVLHDKLTNAYNREFFDRNYQSLIDEYHCDDSKLAIAMLDIDHFKDVNDNFGHEVGDEVLVQFVDTIHKNSRKNDILIRWGGEEFILILKIDSPENLQKILENLKNSIENFTFEKVGTKTCSIGGTIYIDNEDILQTIKRADEAVYKAKELGRNKVVIFE